MRILVLGGTNFIGPFVVRDLVEGGHDVAVLHRGYTEADLPPCVSHIHADRSGLGSHSEDIRRFAPGTVIDMFALTSEDAQAAVRAIGGIANRYIVISSMDVYAGFGRLWRKETGPPLPTPWTEDSEVRTSLFPIRDSASDPRDWRWNYDKLLVERAAASQVDLSVTILRLPIVYGPGDYQHRLHPYLKRMDDGRPAILIEQTWADWQATRGYVENVASAIAVAATDQRAAGRVYNLGEPDSLNEAKWIVAIANVAHWTGNVVRVLANRLPSSMRPPFDTRHDVAASSDRIRQELGYTERVPRDEALRRTIAWERANPPARWDPMSFDYDVEDGVLAST